MPSTVSFFIVVLSCVAFANALTNPSRSKRLLSAPAEKAHHATAIKLSRAIRNAILQKNVLPPLRDLSTQSAIYPSALQTAHFLDTRPLPLYSLLASLPQFASDRSSVQANVSRLGFTFDTCEVSSDCQGIRRCLDISNFPQSTFCTGGFGCFCLPPEPENCRRSIQCATGEVCALLGNMTEPLCASATVEEKNPQLVQVSGDNRPRPPGPSSAGLTYDFCQEPEDCLGERVCTYFEDSGGQCDGRDPCICLADTLEQCATADECPRGEMCVLSNTTIDETISFCASQTTVAQFPELFAPMEAIGPDGEGGLTLDDCKKPEDCIGARTCYQAPPASGIRCPDIAFVGCRCYPLRPATCQDSTECDSGEVCAVEAETKSAICMSQSAADNPNLVFDSDSASDDDSSVSDDNGEAPNGSDETSPSTVSGGADQIPSQTVSPIDQIPSPTASPTPSSDGDICIDARMLHHLSRDELVFPKDLWARVLCDPEDNCATPGHIVVHQERGMMMATYCQKVSCVKRTLLVNSPRYRTRRRVASNSQQLQFTGFAARYSSRIEESVLAMAVRMGM